MSTTPSSLTKPATGAPTAPTRGRGLLGWLRTAYSTAPAEAQPPATPQEDSSPAVTRVEVADYLAQQIADPLRAAFGALGRPGVIAVRCRFDGFCDDLRAALERALSDMPQLDLLSTMPVEPEQRQLSAAETTTALQAGHSRVFVLPHERLLRGAVPAIDHVQVLPRFSPLTLAKACQAFYNLPEMPEVVAAAWVAQVSPADLLITSSVQGNPVPHIRDAVRRRLKDHDCTDAPPLHALIGLSEVRGWAEAVIDDLRDAQDPAVRCTWAQIERAVVFAGPAGVGKRSLSQAIAGAAGLHWCGVSARRWAAAAAAERWSADGGQGAMLAAMLADFDGARALAPAVLFIEDLAHLPAEAMPQLGELIAQPDPHDPVFVIGSVDDAELPDDASLQLAHFERTVHLPLPTSALLAQALRQRLAGLSHNLSNQDIAQVGRLALGETTASLDLFVRRAQQTARRAGHHTVTFDDMAAAVLGTPEPGARPKVSDDELRITAHHEAGHAVMHFLGIREGRDIQYATIVPRRLGDGTALGFVMRGSDETRHSLSRAEALALMRMFLGGRAAEEILCGADHISTGAGGSRASDLAKATDAAAYLIGRCGFNARGSLVYRPATVTDDRTLCKEVDALLSAQYAQVLAALKQHWHLVQAIATRLMTEQELSGDEVREALRDAANNPLTTAQRTPAAAAEGEMAMQPFEDSASLRTGPWWHRLQLQIHLDANARQGQPGDLLVGIGSADGDDAFVALNVKHPSALAGATRGGLVSVSELVLAAPPALLAQWRRCFPQGMASVKRLVVEDASLDTCMALLLFARAVRAPSGAGAGAGAGVGAGADAEGLGAVQAQCVGDAMAEQRLLSWVGYTAAWEAGQYTDGPDFSLSAACQMAALAHSLLAGTNSDAAVRACLSLLDGYISINAQATDALPPRHLRECEQATVQLAFEMQLYARALKQCVQTQLLVPIQNATRSLLVDALIFEDIELAGILKVLARCDRVNSRTQRGFALLALRRPAAAGTGNDMVISVDPRAGITLEPLWQALEDREDRAWGTERPRHDPRLGIKRYTDPATGQATANAPNQPWYDDQGRYTLIAAPKALAPGRPGSRLSWGADVLPALWEVFKPLALPAVQSAHTPGRRVATVTWPRGQAPVSDGMPVLQQWLASCSSAAAANHPGEFEAHANLRICQVPGGEVVAHAGGVTLSDDWSSTTLDPRLQHDAAAMAKIADDYDALLQDKTLDKLFAEMQSLTAKRHQAGEKHWFDLREHTLTLKQSLIGLSIREDQLHSGTGHRALLQTLETAWDLSDARHRLWDTASRMEELLQQTQAQHHAKAQFFMTRIVSAAGVFVFVHELIGAVANVYTMNEFERLAMIAEKLGVDAVKLGELQQQAALSDMFDAGAVVAWVVIFAGALGLAWRRYRGVGAAAFQVPKDQIN